MMWPRLVMIACAAALAGCAAMPLSSMWALRKIELETTDFSTWRAALKSPSFVRTTAAKLKVDVILADGVNRGGDFTLIEATDSMASLRLVTEVRSGEQMAIYRLADSDVAKLDGHRAGALRAKAEATQKGQVGIGVSAQGCSFGVSAPGPVMLSTYLKTSETMKFVALLDDVDVLALSKARTAAEVFKPCDSKG